MKAALFDMDGTIIDSEPYWMVAERELHAEVLGTAPPVETAVVATIMSDDDLDDALF